MEDLDYVDLCRQMVHLAHRGKEQAARPEASARERRLLRRQIRAAEEAALLYNRAAGAPTEREAVRLLVKAQKHQKTIMVTADKLLGGV